MKEHMTYLVCEEDTSFLQLKHERKTVYLDTQRFLPMLHHYRRLRKAFKKTIEEGKAPKKLNGELVYDRVKHLIASYEKVKQNTVDKHVLKKRSIFFISHIEKNYL